MKKYVLDFLRRGFIASGIGPVVLAILYLILQQQADLKILTINQVCTGIFSLTLLAFIAGGMNTIYQIERLPLMTAILIHGVILYIGYLATYLINGWLEEGTVPVLIFTAIFIMGYLVIWAIIYSITKKRTRKLNEILKKKYQNVQK